MIFLTLAAALVLRGDVYTLDDARPWARAVLVEGAHIVYVGDEREALRLAGPRARVIDGAMILPGFHDAHTHPMTSGMTLLRCNLRGLVNEAQVSAHIRDCAAHDHGAWLLGTGWDPKAFAADRRKLDALVPDRPALFTTDGGFEGWANSKALALGETGGDGILHDAEVTRVKRRAPRPGEAEYREALRRTTTIENSFGVTSLVDASVDAPVVEAYRAADRAGGLTVRVGLAQRIDNARGEEQIAAMTALRDRAHGRRLRADAAKFFLDGEIDRRSAAMLARYAGSADRGELMLPEDRLDALVRRLDAAGFMIHMHAMGDRAIRAALDAFAGAAAANGARDRRHQLAHVGVVDPADVRRFAQLGVTANFQPLFAAPADPVLAAAAAALGPARARWLYPIASIRGAGGRVIASSDWPSTTMNLFEAIEAAVTRAPPESSTVAQMIAAYTRDAAWAEGEDTGVIAAGRPADLVVLDRNLFAVPASRIRATRVLLTLLDGEAVYGDPALEQGDKKRP